MPEVYENWLLGPPPPVAEEETCSTPLGTVGEAEAGDCGEAEANAKFDCELGAGTETAPGTRT